METTYLAHDDISTQVNLYLNDETTRKHFHKRLPVIEQKNIKYLHPATIVVLNRVYPMPEHCNPDGTIDLKKRESPNGFLTKIRSVFQITDILTHFRLNNSTDSTFTYSDAVMDWANSKYYQKFKIKDPQFLAKQFEFRFERNKQRICDGCCQLCPNGGCVASRSNAFELAKRDPHFETTPNLEKRIGKCPVYICPFYTAIDFFSLLSIDNHFEQPSQKIKELYGTPDGLN